MYSRPQHCLGFDNRYLDFDNRYLDLMTNVWTLLPVPRLNSEGRRAKEYRMSGRDSITPRQTSDAVLRRAIEMDDLVPSSNDVVLDETQLAEIATELGISQASLSSALAEARAGVPSKRSVLDRIVGPKQIWASRQTSDDEDEEHAQERIIEWLEIVHGFRPRVRDDGVIVATKRRDLVGVVGSGVRRVQGLGGLAKVSNVQAAAIISPSDEDPSGAVCLVVDIGNKRNEAIAGGVAITAAGTVVVGMASLIASPLLLVGVPIAAGVGAVTSRLVHRQNTSRVSESLEHTVDGIARDEAPPRALGSLRRRKRR